MASSGVEVVGSLEGEESAVIVLGIVVVAIPGELAEPAAGDDVLSDEPASVVVEAGRGVVTEGVGIGVVDCGAMRLLEQSRHLKRCCQ